MIYLLPVLFLVSGIAVLASFRLGLYPKRANVRYGIVLGLALLLFAVESALLIAVRIWAG